MIISKKGFLALFLTAAMVLLLIFSAAPAANAETTGWTRDYVKYEETFVQDEPMTIGFYFNCNSTATEEALYFWLLQGGNAVPLGSFTGTFTSDGVYYFTFPAPAAGVYDGYMYSNTPKYSGGNAGDPFTILKPSEEKYWGQIVSQIVQMADGASLEVDTTGITSYVPFYVLDALRGTSKTLTARSGGDTFVFYGHNLGNTTPGLSYTLQDLEALGYLNNGGRTGGNYIPLTGDMRTPYLFAGFVAVALLAVALLLKRRRNTDV